MDSLYEHIERLAKDRGFKNITSLCREAGVPRATMTELKTGRSKGLSKPNAQKFAKALNVSLNIIYGIEQEKPAGQIADRLTEEDIQLLSQKSTERKETGYLGTPERLARGMKMKWTAVLCLLLYIILSGCESSKAELEAAYQEGYRDGERKAEDIANEALEEAYQNGLKDGAASAYGWIDYQPTYEDEIWNEGYDQGFYDGYQERKKDEKAGAPDQYESYDEWFKFWFGVYPADVPPPQITG